MATGVQARTKPDRIEDHQLTHLLRFNNKKTGKAEAHTLGFHYPVSHRTGSTTTEAVKQVGLGADNQTRGKLIMERAAKSIVLCPAS